VIWTSPASSWAKLRSISHDPKRCRAGGETSGSSCSCQWKVKRTGSPGVRLQVVAIRPDGADSIPHLAALVANPCKAIDGQGPFSEPMNLGSLDVKAPRILAQIGLKHFVDDLAKFRSRCSGVRMYGLKRGTPASVRALELAIG
jgi:hypothetical protein